MPSSSSTRPDGIKPMNSTSPANIPLLFMPPCPPELPPLENLFQFLPHNFPNARVYDTCEDIVDTCCRA